jgi:hypothetical protein
VQARHDMSCLLPGGPRWETIPPAERVNLGNLECVESVDDQTHQMRSLTATSDGPVKESPPEAWHETSALYT